MGRGTQSTATELHNSPEGREFASIKHAADSLRRLVNEAREYGLETTKLRNAEETLAYYEVDPGSVTLREIEKVDALLGTALEAVSAE